MPQDYAQALRWYREAADQGNSDAQVNLGVMYEDCQGVPQDYAEAVRWFRKAADQGHAGAQFNLGVMYGQGHGVPRDYAEAYVWLKLAASHASSDKQKDFAWARDLVAKKMTPQQIADAQRPPRESKPTNAK